MVSDTFTHNSIMIMFGLNELFKTFLGSVCLLDDGKSLVSISQVTVPFTNTIVLTYWCRISCEGLRKKSFKITLYIYLQFFEQNSAYLGLFISCYGPTLGLTTY